MITSSPLNGTGNIAMKPWALLATAGAVLAVDAATACVCIFAIPLPVLPVLAVCGPVAASMIGFIVWRVVTPEVTPSGNAKTGKQNLGGNTLEGSRANGGGNGLEGPIPDVEDITNDDREFDPLAIMVLKFLGRRDGKLLFEANESSFFFTAESLDVALGECSNMFHLAFDGSVPEDLVIKAEVARNLGKIEFANIPNITEFRTLSLFDVLPRKLRFVDFKNCGELTDVTVIPNLETNFFSCEKLCNIYVGDGPYNPPYRRETHSVLPGNISSDGDNKYTEISVSNCRAFDFERMGEFNVQGRSMAIESNCISLFASRSITVGDCKIRIRSTNLHDVTAEIPPQYKTVRAVGIESEPEESEGGILFRLPGGLSVSKEVNIFYRTEDDTIGKCILDFNQPRFIYLDSATVEHIVLTNRQESGSRKVTSCSVVYKPSDSSTVEIENLTSHGGDGEVCCDFQNNGSKDVNLPKIKINGRDLKVAWYKKDDVLHPIIQEKSEIFSEKSPNHKLDTLGKWHVGEYVAIPASWTFIDIE